MPVRTLNASDVRILGQAKVTINSATTTSFDFGTPDDINLAALSNYKHGDKLLVVFSATTAGTTDTVSFVVQDAPDSAGSIGTPATAVTDGTLTGGTGDRRTLTAVQIQPGRPWIRCRVTSTGATDTFVASAIVLALGPMS
jgi:hypothetical protein